MMKKIIYTRIDGGLSVVSPIRNTYPPESLSDEDILNRAMKDVETGATKVRVVDSSEIPTDRTFRDAWIDSGSSIGHDMDKCRSIFRDRLRAARKVKLTELDVSYIRADEAGDTSAKAAIAEQKQTLRDVTADPRIDAAQTPDDLKAIWPDCLKN